MNVVRYDQRSILADERNIVEKFRGKRVLYLIYRRHDSIAKIGISQNPGYRLSKATHRFGWGFYLVQTWAHPNPSQIEAIACTLWKDNCIHGREWMRVSKDDAIAHIDSVIKLCKAARNDYQFVRYLIKLLGEDAVKKGPSLLRKYPGLKDMGGRKVRAVLGIKYQKRK